METRPTEYSVTRRTLDPILRKLAADTPGFELIAGWTAVGLLGDGRPAGVLIERRTQARAPSQRRRARRQPPATAPWRRRKRAVAWITACSGDRNVANSIVSGRARQMAKRSSA
jgi:hypothetical protein